MTILIPAAGLGRRMKSLGPKALIPIGRETVITRQIRILNRMFPHAKIVVVVGFQSERIIKKLPAWVQVVHNDDYEDTNVSHSIHLGLKKCPHNEPVMIVYGDLVFNKAAFTTLDISCSSVIVDNDFSDRKKEVGVNIVDDYISCFSFGLPQKWSQIALLHAKERYLFDKAFKSLNCDKLFGFEILNEIINLGGNFLAHTPLNMKLVEIDSSKDILKALTIKY